MYRCYEASRTKKSGRTSSNLYLQLKWDLINYENHRYNVRTAKHSIDNKAPLTYSHLYYRPKKLQLELERFCAIQRINKSLMQRIATIQREGAWIDNKNFHEIKSLNTWKRQQEMIELAYNNQAMLSRLLDCHTVYNKHKIEDEYLVFQKHKANVQKFPKDWRNIVQQIKLMKEHIKEMVIAMRTGKYKPEMEKRIQRMALDQEAREMQKAERAAEAAERAEEKKRLEREEHSHSLREMRKGREKWKEESKKWRDAREERLRLIKEQREKKELSLEEAKLRVAESKRKRQEGAKKKLQEWKEQKLKTELKARKKREEEERCRCLAKRRKEAKERREKVKEQKQDGRKYGLDGVEIATETLVKSPSDEGSTDDHTEAVLKTESEDSQNSLDYSFAEEEEKGMVDEGSSEDKEDSISAYIMTYEDKLEEVSLPPDSEKTDATPKTEDDESDSFVSEDSDLRSAYVLTYKGELEEVSLSPDSEKNDATPKTEDDESDSFVSEDSDLGSAYVVTYKGELEEVSLSPDSEKNDATLKGKDGDSDSFVSFTSKRNTGSSTENVRGFDDTDSITDWYSDESFGVAEVVEEPPSLDKRSETEKSGSDALKKDVVEELDGKETKQTPKEREDQHRKDSFQIEMKATDGSGNLQIEKKTADDDQKANATEKSGTGGNSTGEGEDERLEKRIAKGMSESSEKKHKD